MPRTDAELIEAKLRDLCVAGIVVHTGVQFVLADDAHDAAWYIQTAWRAWKQQHLHAWADDLLDKMIM